MRQPSRSADLGGLQNIDPQFSSNALKFSRAFGAIMISFPDELDNVIHRADQNTTSFVILVAPTLTNGEDSENR